MTLKEQSGFAVILALMAGVCMALFSFMLLSMSQSYRTQVGHTDRRQASFKIAYSGYSTVLAKTWSQPWRQRFFKDSPGVIEENLFGGHYEAFVHDSPGKENMFDIYVLTTLDGLNQLYFWRVKRPTDMINIAGGFRAVWSSETSVENFPENGNFPLAQEVDDLMAERENNRENAEETARRISAVNDIRDIVEIIGARVPQFPTGDWPSKSDPFVSTIEEPVFPSIDIPEVELPADEIQTVNAYINSELQEPLDPKCPDCEALSIGPVFVPCPPCALGLN